MKLKVRNLRHEITAMQVPPSNYKYVSSKVQLNIANWERQITAIEFRQTNYNCVLTLVEFKAWKYVLEIIGLQI